MSAPPPPPARPAERSRLAQGIAAGVGAALIWGVQAVVSRQSVSEGLTAGDVTVLRFLAAGLLLAPLALRMRPVVVGRMGLGRALALTALAGAPYSLVLIGGAAFAPAVHASVILSGLNPVLAILLGVLVAREWPGALRALGAALIVAGLLMFAARAFAASGARAGAWRGDILFALNAAMFVVYARLVRLWDIGAREATVATCVLSLASVPLWLWAVPTGLSGASLAAILWQGLYQGVAVGVVSILLFTRCVALIGPVRAAMFIPLMPLTTAAAGMLVLGEWPQPLEWAGMIVVLAGMMLALGGPARAGQ